MNDKNKKKITIDRLREKVYSHSLDEYVYNVSLEILNHLTFKSTFQLVKKSLVQVQAIVENDDNMNVCKGLIHKYVKKGNTWPVKYKQIELFNDENNGLKMVRSTH